MASPESVLDLTNLLEAFDDDRPAVAELLLEAQTFAAQSRATIDSACTAGDAPAVVQAAHALKGTAANIGAKDVAAVSAACETAAKAGDLAVVRARLPDLDLAVGAMRTAISTFAASAG